jgi:hypothetical protein
VPTLVDFGIARRTDATTMTRGLVLGTASYLAPEQAQGLPLTPAADVYSLACVLHELLTGAPPFQGDGPVAIAFKHVNDAPEAPSSLEPSIPPALDAVLLRCLAKDPTARPADGSALAAELRRALAPDGESTVAIGPIVAAGPATEVLPAAPLAGTDAGATAIAPAAVPAPAAAVARDGVPWRIIAAVVVAALVLALLWSALAGDDAATVPAIIGVDTATALDELDDAGLRADVFEVDSDQPAGTVVMTGPGPGLDAEPGSTVKVAVSNGSAAATTATTAAPPPAETGDDDDDDDGEGRGEGRGKKKDDD